ncbi:carbohydrate ABC transporter permease [Cohnella silvisoli]|uniref:Carbohydrate ABC transporter permease n=1 Tax=Cohnella silvisoli TaxID=2873699 RepID=A0ABV1KRK6_9BACL|nr:carbohydrate ABC transporter permease [Cohnella silvisoli]MCD9021724.1 carbohydrate ABC transporter permease [Cohnella silvisoli]
MKVNTSFGKMLFPIFNYTVLIAFALLCLLPMIHVLAISFSSGTAAAAGYVTLWPINFTFKAYEFVANKPEFIRSMIVSFKRVLIGVPIDMLLIILIAYPLSKDERMLSFRKAYIVFFMITILFGGGLIPWYMVIKMTGLIDSIFALILPGAVPVFSVIILLNFFRNLPKEIEEAAFIDGASHWYTLWKIYVPLSMPAIATLILFSSVGHWNSWFDGIILMNRTEHYPLQSYLQTVVVQQGLLKMVTIQDTQTFLEVSNRTNKAAQIFIGALPILLVYPFLQRYFMSGIVLGSVKG